MEHDFIDSHSGILCMYLPKHGVPRLVPVRSAVVAAAALSRRGRY